MIVRRAEQNDVHGIVALGRKLHKESEYSILKFNQDKAVKMVSSMVESESHAIFIVFDGSDMIGMIGCECETTYFSDEKVSGEHMVYVIPEKRASMAFSLLINKFIEWSTSKNAKALYLRTSSGINAIGIDKIYRRLGFDQVGGIYRSFS